MECSTDVTTALVKMVLPDTAKLLNNYIITENKKYRKEIDTG